MSLLGMLQQWGLWSDGENVRVHTGGLRIGDADSQTSYIKTFLYEASVADNGTVKLPDATDGFVFVSSPAEALLAQVNADGTVVKIGGSTNTAVTDSDGDLCVYDGGTNGVVKNALGGEKAIKILYLYFSS